jgi:hypothetical protein
MPSRCGTSKATFSNGTGFVADIEDRKRAEYLTGQVFESSPDGISILGRDYRYQRVNPVYERFWRMPAVGIPTAARDPPIAARRPVLVIAAG